jgi:hypothetical protein
MRELKGFLRAGAAKAYPIAKASCSQPPSFSEIVVHLSFSPEAYAHRAGMNDAESARFLIVILSALEKDEEYYREFSERMALLSGQGVQVWPGFSVRRKRQKKTPDPNELTANDKLFLRSLRISWDQPIVA